MISQQNDERGEVEKNFRLVARDVAIAPILAELARWPEAWDLQVQRQKIAVQRESRSIPIRGLRKSRIGGRSRRDAHETRYTTISRQFPQTTRFICRCAQLLDSELGRAKLVSLPVGHQVYAHSDRGDYYARRDRYHLVLQSDGSQMRCGDEQRSMSTGELWWFDNKKIHEAQNNGNSDRIHLIFDLEPRNGTLGPLVTGLDELSELALGDME